MIHKVEIDYISTIPLVARRNDVIGPAKVIIVKAVGGFCVIVRFH